MDGSSSTLAKVDGQQATFTYLRTTSERRLIYNINHDDVKTVLEAVNIIGVYPFTNDNLTNPEKVYSVLYVEKPDFSSDATPEEALPRLKTITTTNPPKEFVDDFMVTRVSTTASSTSQPPGIPSIHVIISTLSGVCLAEKFWKKTVHLVFESLRLKEGIDYMVHYTKSVASVTEITGSIILSQANNSIKQSILLLSGDGGIIDIVNSLLSTPIKYGYIAPELSIIPMGTANALAHSSGITKDNTLGLSSFARGKPKSLPLFKVTFSSGAKLLVNEGTTEEVIPNQNRYGKPIMFGAVVCSWGMHAGLVADSDTAEYRKFGIQRFQMAAKEALFPSDGSPPHAYKAKVFLLEPSKTEGGATWKPVDREEHAYILATLVSNLEKTFTISPSSTPLSNQLRLVHFGPMPGNEIMRVMGLAYQGGQHVSDPAVGYEAIEGLRIEFAQLEADARWRRICVDGKIIRVEQNGWVEVRMDNCHALDILSV